MAEVADWGTLVRFIRAALLHEVAEVELPETTLEPGRHVLQLRLGGRTVAELAAEAVVASAASAAGARALRLSPLDPSHVPELTALTAEPERVDSALVPPTPARPRMPSVAPATERGTSELEVITEEEFAVASARAAFEARAPSVRPVSSVADADASQADPRTQRNVPRWTSIAPPSDLVTDPVPSIARASTAQPSSSLGPRTQRRASGDHGIVFIGRVIANRYRIESRVGAGAVGTVYKAQHVELGRPFAIKVLHPHYRNDPQLLGAFRTEAHSASLLDHPNVAAVHDFGEESDGLVYIVMEYLQGVSLQAVLDEERRLQAPRAIGIMLQICSALSAAHERGIIHRDVKPDNVMLIASRDDDGGVRELAKVCDFGIATPESAPGEQRDWTAGTPEYMAPELAQGHADARTDVYACGIVLYEMLTGRPPFLGESPLAVLAKHEREQARPPSELAPGLVPDLERIILRAIEKSPAQRFASMRELRAELRRLL